MPSKHTDNGSVLLGRGRRGWRVATQSVKHVLCKVRRGVLSSETMYKGQAFWRASVIPVLKMWRPEDPYDMLTSHFNPNQQVLGEWDCLKTQGQILRISMHRWVLSSSLYIFMCAFTHKCTWTYIYIHTHTIHKAWIKVIVDLYNNLTLSPWCL